MSVESVAFIGIVGGAGTTRTVLELGAVLARGGQSALVIDLDFATQGLERFLEDRIEPDATALLADEAVELADAVHDWEVEGSGRLGLVPAFAPFAELAKAKSATAGARIADRLDEATAEFDHVLLDVPPVASNQAVGAVTAAEAVVGVIPPTERGVDSLQRERGRLADIGTAFDQVLAVGAADDAAPPDADHAIPTLPSDAPYRPVTLDSNGGFTERMAAVADAIFDLDVAESIDASGSLIERFEAEIRR